jgi:hypothetical protein
MNFKLPVVAIYLLTCTTVLAQSRGSTDQTYSTPTTLPQSVNAATTSSTSTDSTSYTPIVTNSSGIQSAGQSSSGNNMAGVLLGEGATVFTTYKATACCSGPQAAACGCPYWIAGVVASVAVTGYMTAAKDKSDGTVAGVTDDGTTATRSVTPTTLSNTSTAVYNQDPAWQNVQQSLDQLKSSGWNIDPKTGTATNTATGQTITPSDLSSPAAMSAAGFSASDIKGIQSVLDQAQAAGKKYAAAHGADASGSVFDGTIGGGKSGSTSGVGAMAGAALRAANRQAGMGINRDPAQVAGMSKSYNGDQIGVAQDSLFNMIDRRYQLHDRNGSFIP